DLVFLDMQMPIMDGAETFRHLRQLLPNLKVIITSGYSESEAMTLMAQDEQVDFIQKPFRMKQLLAKMQGLLAKASD
ncbi:MAG: response regulator, partial [Chloroflexota bacterium]